MSAPYPSPADAAPLVTVREASVFYGEHEALSRASVTLRGGQFSAIIGPNGAGKSTLLKALLGLTPLSSGDIQFTGLTPSRRGPQDAMAYVPQQQTLDWAFPVTVWDTAMMGRTARLGWGRWPGAKDRERVSAALRQAGVYELRQRHIGALSGGQRQRVLLARMLARDAQILLLDEPLTGVDISTQQRVMELLRAQANEGRAVVMVTHDLETAAAACDQLILINRTVIAQGRPDEVYTPANVAATFSSSFLGPNDPVHGHPHA